jgi:protein-disulfide isomerase
MNRHVRYRLLVSGLVGLLASGSALYMYYRIGRDPSYSAFCHINQTIDCYASYLSPYGSIGGVPVALPALLWFAASLLVTVGFDPVSPREEWTAPAYVFVLAVPALGVALFYAYVSLFVIKVLCVLCELILLAVGAVFLTSAAGARVPLSAVPWRARRDVKRFVRRPMALTVTVLFVAVAVLSFVVFPRVTGGVVEAAQTASQMASFEKWFSSQPRVPIVLPTDGARVLVLKFSDYECPSCAETYFSDRPVFARFQAEQPGAVKLIMKDYPLAPECNPNVSQLYHQFACEAAAAARMAERRQRGEAMQEWLFTHRAGLSLAAIKAAAREVGGVTDFEAEYPRVLMEIRSDVELAGRLNVRGTPTFFINGVRIDGGLRPAFLEAAIQHELRAAAGANP